MTAIASNPLVAAFVARLRAAPCALLALDYDGTLAPFHVDPARAMPYPVVMDWIDRILEQEATRVVIVSGRAIRDLTPLIRLRRRVELWGSHGWERLLPDGEYHLMQPPRAAVNVLERASTIAAVHCERGARLERKRAAVALHWRGLPQDQAEEIRQALHREWRALVSDAPVSILAFDGGLEMRALGRTKGDVVRTLLDEIGHRAAAAYLGDDVTDEDAFDALKAAISPEHANVQDRPGVDVDRNVLAVLVRQEPRESRADIRIAPPEELVSFLQCWLDTRDATR